MASALVFLELNGREVHVPPAELYALTMQAITGEADDEVVAAYFRDRMTPESEWTEAPSGATLSRPAAVP